MNFNNHTTTTNPAATIDRNSEYPILNIWIKQGDNGNIEPSSNKGDTGNTGDKGSQGQRGSDRDSSIATAAAIASAAASATSAVSSGVAIATASSALSASTLNATAIGLLNTRLTIDETQIQ